LLAPVQLLLAVSSFGVFLPLNCSFSGGLLIYDTSLFLKHAFYLLTSYSEQECGGTSMTMDETTSDAQLAKACREALEKQYGFTIPVPKCLLKKGVRQK
jgi:hypothetical protein